MKLSGSFVQSFTFDRRVLDCAIHSLIEGCLGFVSPWSISLRAMRTLEGARAESPSLNERSP